MVTRRQFLRAFWKIRVVSLLLLHITDTAVDMIVSLSLAVIVLKCLNKRLDLLISFLVALVPALRLHFIERLSAIHSAVRARSCCTLFSYDLLIL